MEEMRGKNFGSNNQSALGQLEDISGGKVSRPASQKPPRTTTTRPIQQPRPATPRYDSDQVLKQQFTGALAGALVGALFSNLLNDDSAAKRQAQAEAEARARAEAAAQAEALRVQQELARQARIRQAQHYRADWDAREADITNRLGGAFATSTNAHRNLFGSGSVSPDDPALAAILGQMDVASAPAAAIPNIPDVPAVADPTAPDPVANDPAVVDLRSLRGGTHTVTLLGTGTVSTKMPPSSGTLGRTRWDEWPQPSSPRRQQPWWVGMVDQLQPMLGERINSYAEGVIKDAIVERFVKLKNKIPGHEYYDAAKKFNDERNANTKRFWEEIGSPLESHFEKTAMDSAYVLGSGRIGGEERVLEEVDRLPAVVGTVEKNTGKWIGEDIKKRLSRSETEASEEPAAKTFVRSNPEGREIPNTLVVPSRDALHLRDSLLGKP